MGRWVGGGGRAEAQRRRGVKAQRRRGRLRGVKARDVEAQRCL